jgi:NAD(P)-dependent dehydrogenase (short-subunit alcohol dehydrogenase family)
MFKPVKREGKAVLITGATRSIGRALLEEVLRRVYAATRQPLAHVDRRVTSLLLDVTDAKQLVAANIVDALEPGDEDIFPDPMSQTLAEGWRRGVAKGLKRQYAPVVPSPKEHG